MVVSHHFFANIANHIYIAHHIAFVRISLFVDPSSDIRFIIGAPMTYFELKDFLEEVQEADTADALDLITDLGRSLPDADRKNLDVAIKEKKKTLK